KKESKSESAKRNRGPPRINHTKLECPECDISTRSVSSWMLHLRYNHSITPALAGLALLCECGHESLSEKHSRVCTVANVTIIRKRDIPIRRLGDEKY
ncbi:hypothetical protein PENTCL1PPCAC_5239, partial [Pristionchus entomophagus]